MRYFLPSLLALTIACASHSSGQDTTAPFAVNITVDAGKPGAEMTPIWRFFGADEGNYAYMKDGQKLLGELGKLGTPQVYFRCHHLLTSGDGSYALKWGSTSAYKEDAQGRPIYDWSINDRIFDTYLARGIRPYVEIGFMPEALTIHPQNYPHNPPVNERADPAAGQAYPPKDYVKWGNLCYEWARHCLEKYGHSEVEKWYWEVWNEPNIMYWHGTPQEYCKLYDYTVDGVRRAIPDARVGGPETAGGPGGKFLGLFLQHCSQGTNYVTGKRGAPLDFISFHAKGSPSFVDGHVRMSMAAQFKNIDDACALIASFPQYQRTPIVIGECDPEGCAACRTPADAYRNGTMYSSYTAASFARIPEIAQKRGVNMQGALTWAFEFEDQPPFAGFRQLASSGIDLPVLNVFRMFGMMGGQTLPTQSNAGLTADTIRTANVRAQPDISALAARDGNHLAILLWHYHDDDLPGPAAAITLTIAGLQNSAATAKEYLIDETHSNSYTAWQAMGSPLTLTAGQRDQLEKAGQLAQTTSAPAVHFHDGKAAVALTLPRQGVALLLVALK